MSNVFHTLARKASYSGPSDSYQLILDENGKRIGVVIPKTKKDYPSSFSPHKRMMINVYDDEYGVNGYVVDVSKMTKEAVERAYNNLPDEVKEKEDYSSIFCRILKEFSCQSAPLKTWVVVDDNGRINHPLVVSEIDINGYGDSSSLKYKESKKYIGLSDQALLADSKEHGKKREQEKGQEKNQKDKSINQVENKSTKSVSVYEEDENNKQKTKNISESEEDFNENESNNDDDVYGSELDEEKEEDDVAAYGSETYSDSDWIAEAERTLERMKELVSMKQGDKSNNKKSDLSEMKKKAMEEIKKEYEKIMNERQAKVKRSSRSDEKEDNCSRFSKKSVDHYNDECAQNDTRSYLNLKNDPSPPTEIVSFVIPNFGHIDSSYHKVVRDGNFLVLVYDNRWKYSTKYMPKENNTLLTAYVDSLNAAFVVASLGISYTIDDVEHCVLIIEKSIDKFEE